MDFNIFKRAVAAQFAVLVTHGLYRSSVSKDDLWDTYLKSFPEGTNPVYKERTEHDCTCCKQFIRAVGDTVSIIDGEVVSIWDVTMDDPAYQAVADALADLVSRYPIENKFLHGEPTAGTDKNFQQLVTGVKTWTHFHVNIPKAYQSKDAGPTLGEHRATFDVMKRGLTELQMDAVDTVLDLISQNSLYRGEEHKASLLAFKKLHAAYDGTDIFIWKNLNPANRFRNTVIGTLVTDLSSGVGLEDAVKMFESKVAPTNYKRPTALVTKAMIEKAKKSIEEAGLTSALERRYATINDITVNNILFADRDTPLVKDVFDDLIATAPAKTFDKVEEVTIDKFIIDILPRAKTLEVMMENGHQPNLVSLIAPVDPTANNLFKWNNKFSWDYNGGVADSIREKVKNAGGNVTGEFCCRLAWENTDDLDFHMEELVTSSRIYFGNRNQKSPCGGMLDVDANGSSGMMEHPVENIFYKSISTMPKGDYLLKVHNYYKRGTTDQGFEVEIDIMGNVYNYTATENPKQGVYETIAAFKKDRAGLHLVTVLKQNKAVKTFWGVNTNTFTKVNVLMHSPNHWDGEQTGNRHYFFFLANCLREGSARGIYNEFLKENLTEHRKTLEMVGSKLKVEAATNQLGGLGFSTTQRNTLLCRVTGAFTRTVKIVF